MSKEREVALQGKSLPEEYVGKNGKPIGTENISPEDILLPQLNIIQPTSKDSEKGLGSFINSVTGDVYQKLDIVPILVQKGRVKFVESKMDLPPECKSLDGITSVDGKICAECEYSKWGENSKAPACAEQRNFPVLLVDDGSVAVLSMKRTAMPVAKQLITMITFKKTPFFFYSVSFVTRKVEGSAGKYYVPEIQGKLIETSNETRAVAFEWVKRLAQQKIEVHYDTEE